jgi:hypothetical protein
MPLPRIRASASRATRALTASGVFPALAALAALAAPASASRFAIGTQWESWNNVEVEMSKNPGNKNSDKLGNQKLEFDVGGITNYYLEEPGFIFSLIAGMAGSEANEVNARNEAIKKGDHVYHWSYAEPPPIPTGRWFRWGYSHAFASGGTRTFHAMKAAGGGDTVVTYKDPDLRFDYIRLDANMVTAPRLIGNSDFYWMVGSDFSGTSLKIYGGSPVSKNGVPSTDIIGGGNGQQPGDDWSFATTPLNLHMGWQPSFFPYLMIEANGGIDFIDPIGNLFLGFKNYTPYSEFGAHASLGTDWLSVYYDISHEVDPLYDGGAYSRRYTGLWSVFGTRLDIGNLFMKLFK